MKNNKKNKKIKR